MKKLLLLAAIAATSLGASAQTFGEIFEVTDEKGQVLESGTTITVDTYEDYLKGEGADIGLYSLAAGCAFYAKNINEEPYQLACEITRVNPSLEAVPAGEGGFGDYQACFDYSDGSVSGSCTSAHDGEPYFNLMKDVDVDVTVKMDVHQLGFDSLDPVTILFTYYVIEAEEKLEGAQFDIFIKFTHKYDISNGVAGIDADAADAEYFTLQGVRVANPVKGQLYIVRQGDKVRKAII